jgi:hypothetical protein
MGATAFAKEVRDIHEGRSDHSDCPTSGRGERQFGALAALTLRTRSHLAGETLHVLRMIHGARDWPDQTWPSS